MMMTNFMTKRLPVAPDAIAPDGSDVRILPGLKGGGNLGALRRKMNKVKKKNKLR